MEEWCARCAWMTEEESGPHCSVCCHRYGSEFRPISNRGLMRLKTNDEVAYIMATEKPYCKPIEGDPACGGDRCAECIKHWLDAGAREKRGRASL